MFLRRRYGSDGDALFAHGAFDECESGVQVVVVAILNRVCDVRDEGGHILFLARLNLPPQGLLAGYLGLLLGGPGGALEVVVELLVGLNGRDIDGAGNALQSAFERLDTHIIYKCACKRKEMRGYTICIGKWGAQ